MRLIVARHGETPLNVAHCFYGTLDVGLTETGFAQAKTLAQKLRHVGPMTLMSSAMRRTLTTAAAVQAHTGQAVIIDPAFNEKSFGLWEGLTADEIEAAFPTEWQAWLDAPFAYTPPAATSFATFETRVKQRVAQLIEETPATTTVTVIAHQGVLRVIDHWLFPERDFWASDFQAGHYTSYDLAAGHVQTVLRNQ
ncbi:histidine phosphatase family protein [Furfurilactobacillus sp. WILCCON 0119]|uniref:histidine phosphatase family protein n=1 Tax=Furfurilactobacillus entadae TaxID=2922307 RepID=UPI0035EA06EB